SPPPAWHPRTCLFANAGTGQTPPAAARAARSHAYGPCPFWRPFRRGTPHGWRPLRASRSRAIRRGEQPHRAASARRRPLLFFESQAQTSEGSPDGSGMTTQAELVAVLLGAKIGPGGGQLA